MGSTSRYGRATINPGAPEALGICDRCGFQYNLRQLRYQYEWAGTSMQNMHLRVCPTCMDVPQEQLRAIILPPDPPPVDDPRYEPFAIDERNTYTLQKLIGSPFLFPATSSMAVLLTSASTLVAAFEAIATFSVAMTASFMIEPAFTVTSDFAADLFVPPQYLLTEGGDFLITEGGDRLTTE
jgi:hypothetical protein